MAAAWIGALTAPMASMAIELRSNKPLTSRQLATNALLRTTAAVLLLALMIREFKHDDTFMAQAVAVCAAIQLGAAVMGLRTREHQRRQAASAAAHRAPDSTRKTIDRS